MPRSFHWIALCLVFSAPLCLQAQDVAPTTPSSSLSRPKNLWQFKPSFSINYDSFGQRYEIADEDTLDLIDEVSSRVVTSLDYSGSTRLKFRNSLAIGEEATRNEFYFLMNRHFGRLQVRLQDDFQIKAYRKDSDFSFSSDYITNTNRLSLTWKLTPQVNLRIDERFEFLRVDERTRYNYDFHRNDIGAELQRPYGLFSMALMGYKFVQRTVPDSTAINYQSHRAVASVNHEFGLHSLSSEHVVQRRLYGDPTVRSHYFDYQGRLSLNYTLTPEYRLRPSYRGSVLRYDSPDSVYSNATEQSLEVLLEKDFAGQVVLGAGPRGQFKRTDGAFDRAYNQWGFKGSLSYFAGSRFWIQFTNELGFRSHLAGDDFLYTDYFFNWTTLFMSWEVMPHMNWDVFFSMNPETHDDKQNNTTTMLLSTAITVGRR